MDIKNYRERNMDEDLVFNLEDMDIKEESLNFITEEKEQEQNIKTEQEQEIETEDVSKEEGSEEDKQKTTEEVKEEDKTPPSTQDDSSHSPLYALAKYLKEEGVLYLEKDIEEIKSLEELKNLIAESNSKAKYANLTESQKRYHDALESGIPVNEFEELEKEIKAFEQITEKSIEENENLRFEIIALDLINKGLQKDQAIKLAKLSLSDETNIEDTKTSLKNLVESKKTKFKDIVNEKSKKTSIALEDIKKSIFAKDKLLEMPLNDVSKGKLFDFMTTKVDSDENGLPLNKFQKWQKENPIEASIFTNYLFMVTNEGKDLGLIKKTTTSSAAKELEKKLKSLSFDKDGSLIIPDEMFRGGSNNKDSRFTNEDKITINI